MHVLVTGGAGFIGSHTVEALLREGARVTVLDSFVTGKRSNLPVDSGLHVCAGDVRNPDDVAAAMHGVTHVLHLAAQVSVRASVDDPVGSAAHNITGFLNVATAARRAGTLRVVYASSAAVYGSPRALPLDESCPCEPSSPYGLEKLIDDQYARLFGELYGHALAGLRYFNVYGPRQDPGSPYAGVISRFVERIVRGEPLTVFGDGMQTRDFVYVTDVALANVAALKSACTGAINVGTGVSVTLLDLIDTLADLTGHRPAVRFAAPVPGDVRDSAMRPERMRAVLGLVSRTTLRQGLQALLASSVAAS